MTTAYAFQIEAVQAINRLKGRCLVAYDMGLGKSLISLLWAKENHAWPTVVVCPSTAKFVWQSEALKHFAMRAEVLEGRRPKHGGFPLKRRLVVVNYDILTDWLPFLKSLNPRLVIGDEITAVKHAGTARSRSFVKLCQDVPYVLALSGTPLENRPMELWLPVHVLRPQLFPSRLTFGIRHCGARRMPWGWSFNGASRLRELHRILVEGSNGIPGCFPYNTLVETELGPRILGEIVKNETQVRILTADPETAEVSWGQITAYSERASPDRMVRIKHEAGEFTCTPDHPIWENQEGGWVRAEAVVPGMRLSVLQKSVSNEEVLQVLFKALRNGFYKCQWDTSRNKTGDYAEKEGRMEEVRYNATRKDHLPGSSSKNIGWVKSSICEDLWIKAKKKEAERGTQTEGVRVVESEMARNFLLIPNEEEEILARCCYRKDEGGMEVSWGEEQRQEAESRDTGEIIGSAKEEMGKGQSNWQNPQVLASLTVGEETTYSSWVVGRTTRVLCRTQASGWVVQEGDKEFSCCRFSKTGSQTSYRGRWSNAQESPTTIKGLLEGKGIATSEVVSVEIYERANRQGTSNSPTEDRVYDLEVEGNHTFFANDILVHNCMIRKRKEDVLGDLPPKSRFVVPLPLSDQREYESAASDFIGWLRRTDPDRVRGALRAETITRLGFLKQLAAKLKLPAVLEWIDTFLESGGKLIVFAVHRAIIGQLHDHLGKCAVVVDGSVTGRKRDARFRQFNLDARARVLIGNIRAAGMGWSATACSTVCFAELDWVPGQHAQAEERVHGLHRGVPGQPAAAWWFVAKGTIEEDLCRVLQRKAEAISATLDGDAATDEFDVFDELLRSQILKG